MKHPIKVPAVGESINEVTIARWLKSDGDYVEKDEIICEIESDKASFEIPAENSGILKILAREGETVPVGNAIAEIRANGAPVGKPAESATEAPEKKSVPGEKPAAEKSAGEARPPKPASAEKPHRVVIPTVGESINEVILAQWLKPDGASVAADDLICEIESDKASFEIPAEQSGTLKHLVAEGETVAVGSAIAEIYQEGPSADRESDTGKAETPAQQAAVPRSNGEPPKISPVAANILEQAGIDPARVRGSGPGGKITKEDALQAVNTAQETAPPSPTAPAEKTGPAVAAADAAAPRPADSRGVRRKRMSNLRKTISRRLVAAKNETAMLTTFNEVDMTGIMTVRKKYKEIFKEKHQVGLGFMSFFTRAVCLAMRDWPAINAMIDGDDILYHDYVDISIAVSTPRGLVVPVIRNADKLSLADIEREVVQLATKARENKLSIDEMSGGTFTITNGGVFGSLLSTPIINPPQSAILGMHKIEERPVVLDGQIVIRPMMYVALSYDHRIIDGRESVSFLVRVKELLEDPARMLLEV